MGLIFGGGTKIPYAVQSGQKNKKKKEREREREWKLSGQSPVRVVAQVLAPEDRSSLSHPWR